MFDISVYDFKLFKIILLYSRSCKRYWSRTRRWWRRIALTTFTDFCCKKLHYLIKCHISCNTYTWYIWPCVLYAKTCNYLLAWFSRTSRWQWNLYWRTLRLTRLTILIRIHFIIRLQVANIKELKDAMLQP